MDRASFTAVSTTTKAQHPRRMATLAVLLFVVLHALFLHDGEIMRSTYFTIAIAGSNKVTQSNTRYSSKGPPKRRFFCVFFFARLRFFQASGQAVVTGVVPSPPRFLLSFFIVHRVQQSH